VTFTNKEDREPVEPRSGLPQSTIGEIVRERADALAEADRLRAALRSEREGRSEFEQAFKRYVEVNPRPIVTAPEPRTEEWRWCGTWSDEPDGIPDRGSWSTSMEAIEPDLRDLKATYDSVWLERRTVSEPERVDDHG
jgi:hypothetical protein